MEDLWVKLYDRDGPLGQKRPACMLLFEFRGGLRTTLRMRKEVLSCQGLSWPGDKTIGALRAERLIFNLCQWDFLLRMSQATLARLPLYCICGVRATHRRLAF